MLTIGLTGGIGSGKSEVTQLLAEMGAVTVDADRIGHEIYLPGTEGWKRVVETFGNGVVAADGTIDRKALGAKVFADRAALERLNAIAHPLIGKVTRERVAEARRLSPPPPAVVFEAAVLLEAGWNTMADEVWVVLAPAESRIERVTASRGIAREEVERRIANQVDDDARRRAADVVIENDGTLVDLRRKLERLWAERVEPAPRRNGRGRDGDRA